MSELNACFCIGPQNGEPLCPCQMRNVIVRDGKYIKKEVDLGPVKPYTSLDVVATTGCKATTEEWKK